MFHRNFGVAVRNVLVAGLLCSFLTSLATADLPRVLPEGAVPKDKRLGKPKDLDGYFPFTPSKSKEAWEARAAQVRRQILVANGIWPMPEQTPPNAVVHGKVDRDTYTVERVYSRKLPGLLRDRQSVSSQGQERQVARRALPARPLDRRPLLRQHRATTASKQIVEWGGAVRERRPLSTLQARCACSSPGWAASCFTTT